MIGVLWGSVILDCSPAHPLLIRPHNTPPTNRPTVHLIQHVIREANLLLLWLRYDCVLLVSGRPSRTMRGLTSFPSTPPHSPLSTVAARLQAELPLETDTELKKHLEDLVDHVHALKEQTSSMVRRVDRWDVKARGWLVGGLTLPTLVTQHARAGGLGQVAGGRGAQRAAVPHEPGHLRPDHDHGYVRPWLEWVGGSGLGEIACRRRSHSTHTINTTQSCCCRASFWRASSVRTMDNLGADVGIGRLDLKDNPVHTHYDDPTAGMNFDSLPLLKSPNGFIIFWLLTFSAICTLLGIFRYKNWL